MYQKVYKSWQWQYKGYYRTVVSQFNTSWGWHLRTHSLYVDVHRNTGSLKALMVTFEKKAGATGICLEEQCFVFVQKCLFEVQNVSRCTDTHWCNAVGASASKWGRCLSLSTSIQYQWHCNKCTRNPTSVMINYPCVPSYICTFHNVPPFNTFSHIVCMNKANIYSIYLNIKNKCMHYVKFQLKLDEHTSVSSCCFLSPPLRPLCW